VRYAVKHEYAQTAIDVIARRTRLSFLNAQAALDTLPRVVDIMAEEYGWSSARKASEISNAVVFLTSMGLPASAAPGAAAAAEPKLNTLMGRVGHALYTGLGLRSGSSAGSGVKVVTSSSGRSMIDAAEMESLKAAFRRESSGTSGERLPRVSVLGLVKSIPGFEGVSNKEYDYVLVETGLKSRDDVDMNEFVEVCALYLC
jgi:glycerol-3-phosphate dehydrogenase